MYRQRVQTKQSYRKDMCFILHGAGHPLNGAAILRLAMSKMFTLNSAFRQFLQSISIQILLNTANKPKNITTNFFH